MSHVATIELEVKDLEALAEAARRLGLELIRGQQTYRWFGHSVGDYPYPLPQGFTEQDLGHCEHAIRIPKNDQIPEHKQPYEVGVVRRRDGRPGYTLIWDFFAGGYGLQKLIGNGAANLKREYAAVVARKQAQRSGFAVREVRQADGSMRLFLSK